MGDQDGNRSELLEQLAEARRRIATLEEALAASQQAGRSLREEDQWDHAFLKDFRGIAFRGRVDFTPLMAAGAVEAITGYRPEDFLSGRLRWDQLVHPEDLATLGETIGKLRTIPGYSTEVEYRIRRKDGESRWVHEVLHNIVDASNKPAFVQGLLYDVHARKIVEEELAKNRAILEATAECVPFDFFVIGADGHYILQNAACRTSWGRLIGHTPEEMAPTDDIRSIWSENNRRAFAGEKVEGEVTVHVNGAKRWIYNVVTPIREGSRVYGILGVNIDFTKRRQAEEQLRKAHDELEDRVRERTAELAEANARLQREVEERHRAQEALERERRTLEHLLRASDHERQLIAYDIHDGLAQYLAGAIMHLQITDHLRQRKPAEAAKAFEAGMAMVRESLNEARRLISGVRPPILDESGVVAAVAHLVYDFRANQGPEIEFRSNVNFGRLAPVLENAIYRIAQEGLTNACKYSQSENIRVELVQLGDQVRIEIADQGVGFDPQTVDEGRFGLEGIRERARLLGGNALIDSAPGQGARIVVDVPLVPGKEHGE